MRLDPADIETIARRVAELLDASGRPIGPVRYVDAAQVARVLGVQRGWVYAHARQLGAIRLDGPGGRLRFDLQHVHLALTGHAPDATFHARRRPSRRPRETTREGVELLPYES